MRQTWSFCRRTSRSPSCCHTPVSCITRVSLCSEWWSRCLGIPFWRPSMQSSKWGLSQSTRGGQAAASSGWWVWITSLNQTGASWMNSAPQWPMCLRSNKKLRSQPAEVSKQHICFHCLQSCQKKPKNFCINVFLSKNIQNLLLWDSPRADICADDSADKHQSVGSCKACARHVKTICQKVKNWHSHHRFDLAAAPTQSHKARICRNVHIRELANANFGPNNKQRDCLSQTATSPPPLTRLHL